MICLNDIVHAEVGTDASSQQDEPEPPSSEHEGLHPACFLGKHGVPKFDSGNTSTFGGHCSIEDQGDFHKYGCEHF